MPDVYCVKCSELIAAEESIKCAECNAVFHMKCINLISNKKITRRTAFRCDKCQESSTVASNSDSEDIGGKTSIIKAIKDLKCDLNTTFEVKLSEMETKINDNLKAKLTTIDQSISTLGSSFESAISALTAENETRRVECANLKTRCDDLSQEVDFLKSQILDLQQYSRLLNFEIAGIPATPNENIYLVLEAVCKALNIPWHKEDISAAHRLGTTNNRPPNIIVRFISRSDRAAWLEAARKKKNFDAVHINSTFRPSPIYINEHLTSYSKALLNHARTMVRSQQLAFAWVKEGRILVKERADGRARRVRSFEDLGAKDTSRSRRGGANGRGITRYNYGNESCD